MSYCHLFLEQTHLREVHSWHRLYLKNRGQCETSVIKKTSFCFTIPVLPDLSPVAVYWVRVMPSSASSIRSCRAWVPGVPEQAVRGQVDLCCAGL